LSSGLDKFFDGFVGDILLYLFYLMVGNIKGRFKVTNPAKTKNNTMNLLRMDNPS
jgi:hypothetical protein